MREKELRNAREGRVKACRRALAMTLREFTFLQAGEMKGGSRFSLPPGPGAALLFRTPGGEARRSAARGTLDPRRCHGISRCHAPVLRRWWWSLLWPPVRRPRRALPEDTHRKLRNLHRVLLVVTPPDRKPSRKAALLLAARAHCAISADRSGIIVAFLSWACRILSRSVFTLT